MYIAGIDIGYGFTKAATVDRTICFPSTIGPAIKIQYTSDLISSGRGLEIEREIMSDGARSRASYFIGELAQLQSPFTISPLARERDLEIVRTLTLAALYELRRGASHTKLDPVALVTGLPVAWYRDRDTVVDALTGTFPFTANGEASTAHIGQVRVVPQPFGSLFKMLLSPDGRLIDPLGLANATVAIIDIGTYTTNYAVADHLHYVEPKSGSIPHAMSEVHGLLNRSIAERYDVQLELHQVEMAMREHQITLFGEKHDITPLIKSAMTPVASAILAHAETLWPDHGASLLSVVVTGGGGPDFFADIKNVYRHARLAASPQTSNAEGFKRFGVFKARQ